MNYFKCKMCGGTIEFTPGDTVGVCDSCGTKQTLSKTTDDVTANLFNRANNLRLKCEFDKASQIYEKIVEQDDSDAEAHWGIVLCKYGIEYVEDPKTSKRIPTCHRTLFDAVTADADYLAAIDFSDAAQQSIYEAEARAIDRIQKDILSIVKNEKPFDVFICYKETDENGKRTVDSAIANDVYYQLTQEGLKVFYAAITLEDKLGQEYEPYIFAALNSAKVMLVIGTKPEYFTSVWVKNEWSRFMALMKTDRNKLLIPCYRDMDAYDLPEEFAHLQAQDMSKIGFINDVVRGIKKVMTSSAPTPAVKETVVINSGNANTAPLLRRAFMFIEDGNWAEAAEYCEKVLDQEPECAEAYLGKLMAELQVKTKSALADCAQPFDEMNNYQKAVRFADTKLANELKGYIAHINERNENEQIRIENERINGIYEYAQNIMKSATTEPNLTRAADVFDTIADYKDAKELSAQCREKAKDARNEALYYSAVSAKNSTAQLNMYYTAGYEKAISIFQSIIDYKDSREQIEECKAKIEEIKAEKLRKEKEKQIAEEKAAKKRKKAVAIITPIICAGIAFAIILNNVIIPNGKYNAAIDLYNSGKYDDAITAFEAMDGYKDSDKQIALCETAIKDTAYNNAVSLKDSGKYDEAITAFEAIDGYKDSKEQITFCETTIKEIKYNNAISLKYAGKYEEALTAFEALDGYKDSAEQIEKCNKDKKYATALALYNSGDYDKAIAAFEALNGYKDSADQIEKCNRDKNYATALALYNSGNYDKAIAAFEALNGYKDSADQIEKCNRDKNYAAALALYNSGYYDRALTAFEALDGYKDSAAQIEKCNTAIKDEKYAVALVLYNSGNYAMAIKAFKALNGYKDSDAQIENCYIGKYGEKLWSLKKSCENIKIGDTITFGSYEQDNNTSNGKEDIEWIVLAKDDNKILVISDKALDCQQYDTSYTNATWGDSSLRKWMNGTFLINAFELEERAQIKSTNVYANKNPSYSTAPGISTIDKIFLLSITEAKKYFLSDEDRKCIPTAYAIAQGAFTSGSYTEDGTAICSWWLRSPGEYQNYAAYVYYFGSVRYSGLDVTYTHNCVRPAMWIEIPE